MGDGLLSFWANGPIERPEIWSRIGVAPDVPWQPGSVGQGSMILHDPAPREWMAKIWLPGTHRPIVNTVRRIHGLESRLHQQLGQIFDTILGPLALSCFTPSCLSCPPHSVLRSNTRGYVQESPPARTCLGLLPHISYYSPSQAPYCRVFAPSNALPRMPCTSTEWPSVVSPKTQPQHHIIRTQNRSRLTRDFVFYSRIRCLVPQTI